MTDGRAHMMLPLLERQAELTALEHAAAEAAVGVGQVVLVEGGPGAGKTRLLAEARVLGALAGLRVLFASGGELEREYPYGVVRQLFEATLFGPDGAHWRAGAAAAASTVFAPDTAAKADPFATLNGLYWLTANAAAERPLMLMVDDLHWGDRPSVGFLQFLMRRVAALPVVLVIAGRPPSMDVLADAMAGTATRMLRPAPLSGDAAVQLTEEMLGVRPDERFAEACRQSTEGNPLRLVELLRALRTGRIAPDQEHLGVIEDLAPSTLARIGLVRLRRLPEAATTVAEAIAVLGTGAAASSVADLAEVDEQALSGVLRTLTQSEILDAQPPLRFVHPAVRDAVYQQLTGGERDRRHSRAAAILHARAAGPDQLGVHLLLTAPRGLSWVADVLCAAADDAARRGAVESAVTFMRRALEERPADVDFDLLYRLGMAEAAIDPAAAVEHLRAARHVATDTRSRAWIGELIARMLVFTHPVGAVVAARQARTDSPPEAEDQRATLLALEHYAGRFSGFVLAGYAETEPQGERGRMVRAVQAWELALSGGTAEACAALAVAVLGGTEHSLFTAVVASSVLILADDRSAQAFWDEWHADALRHGRAQALIAGGVWQGLMNLRLGRLADAEAALRAALDGPPSWGPGTEAAPAHTLAVLAEVLTERGDLAGAREALDRVPPTLSPDTEGALLCRCAEMRLLVAEHRHEEAVAVGEAALERLQTVTNPAWGPWRSLRAEALAHTGRRDEAVAQATEELELARRWGTPGPLGRALTVLGQLEDRSELLEEAVEITRDPFSRLERARALLALGGAVRRKRRPGDARALLREAHDIASDCGAGALAERIGEELAAAGGRPRPVAGAGATALTHSERRVAELAASGRRNREIAQQLFLSLKTVEVHLTNTYRKLGIHGRADLGGALE